MASFKGDQRYTDRIDDDAHYSPCSDEHSSGDEARVRSAWTRDYFDQLSELYADYLRAGRHMFGGSFHQLGGIAEFGDFVFRYMQPGCN